MGFNVTITKLFCLYLKMFSLKMWVKIVCKSAIINNEAVKADKMSFPDILIYSTNSLLDT